MSSDRDHHVLSRKRTRKLSNRASDDISIEELSPDDMGYDADVEIIRPDRYEEPESDLENGEILEKPWLTVDEELAARMRRLGREQNALGSLSQPTTDRGRKRTSREIDDELSMLLIPQSPDLEIHEVVDGDKPSPAKRRRKKSRRPNAAQHVLRSHAENWTDASEKSEGHYGASHDKSTSPTTASELAARNEEEAMDTT